MIRIAALANVLEVVSCYHQAILFA